MELLGVCSALSLFVVVFSLAAFSLQAAGVWLNVPPVTFGQACAMTLLSTVVVNSGTLVAVLAVRRSFSPPIPVGAVIGVTAFTGSAGVLLTGWLYSKFFEGVWFGKGVALAFLTNVIEAVLIGGAFGFLAVMGFTLN